MSRDYDQLSPFEQIKAGLEDALANVRGELNLKTTTLPAPPLPVSRAKVVALRKRLKMSQSVFAAALNVSLNLVQSWEQGLRKPDRGELRLIEMLLRNPKLMEVILGGGSIERRSGQRPAPKPVARKKAASTAS